MKLAGEQIAQFLQKAKDPESRIMKMRGDFEQCYNAQAAVEVSSILIVGQHVTGQGNDKQ